MGFRERSKVRLGGGPGLRLGGLGARLFVASRMCSRNTGLVSVKYLLSLEGHNLWISLNGFDNVAGGQQLSDMLFVWVKFGQIAVSVI